MTERQRYGLIFYGWVVLFFVVLVSVTGLAGFDLSMWEALGGIVVCLAASVLMTATMWSLNL